MQGQHGGVGFHRRAGVAGMEGPLRLHHHVIVTKHRRGPLGMVKLLVD